MQSMGNNKYSILYVKIVCPWLGNRNVKIGNMIYYWNLQFLNNIIINKTKVLLPQAYVTLADYYLAFQSFNFVRTWWRLFQKRVVRTKFDIYDFLIQTYIQSLEAVKELHHKP
jgi:hypothetical protein